MKKGGFLKRPRSITQKPFTPKTLKPKNTRKLIRRYHVLLKNKSIILKKLNWEKDFKLGKWEKIYKKGFDNPNEQLFKLDGLNEGQLVEKLGQIDGEIEKNGGLEVYQIASTQGQSNKRGSDSSKKLVEWIEKFELKDPQALEIGCLSPENVISTCGIFKSITRIDLHSQHPLIQQQDFMERPLPKSDKEKFHLISCSLVVNFVDSPQGRGEMLKRMTEFLLPQGYLFFVLPLPCIENSRYFNNERMLSIMESLGFVQLNHHNSTKLAYWLFQWTKPIEKRKFKKVELNKGSNKNNFCIVLE